MGVDVGFTWGLGIAACFLRCTTDDGGSGCGVGRPADGFVFLCARRRGHGWRRSVQGANIQ